MGANKVDAARKAGLSRATLYNYMGADWWDDIQSDVEGDGVLSSIVFGARSNIREAIESGDLSTSKWFLERNDVEFSPQVARDSESKEDPWADLSKEELKLLLAHIRDKDGGSDNDDRDEDPEPTGQDLLI